MRSVFLALLAACSFGALAGPQAVEPVLPYECSAPNVIVFSAIRQDALDACRGAQAAIQFLEPQGFEARDRISIEIVPALPEDAGRSAAGCFVLQDRRILVLTYHSFKARRTWFGVPVDKRLYESVATHEVAHAIASCNFRIAAPSLRATEYIAFVAMFATMDEAHRRRILAAAPGAGVPDETTISTIVFLFDPLRFGIGAYRHYLRPENGPAFLQAILAGAALAD